MNIKIFINLKNEKQTEVANTLFGAREVKAIKANTSKVVPVAKIEVGL